MKAYCFDYNGIFITEVEADICQMTEIKKQNQLTSGIKEGEKVIETQYILPALSTLKAPPSELEEGYQWKFQDGDWYASKIPEPEKEAEAEEIELTYADKRAAEYPDARIYLDGIVKAHSDDIEVQEEGKAQVQKYIEDCLAVKAKYPKEV